MFSQKGLLLFLFIVNFSDASFAASKIGPTVGAMMLFGSGKMGNDSDALSRSMIYTPVALFGGFNIKNYRIGINYEYNMVGQSDDPASFSNQNLGGKGSSAGLRLEYYNGKTAFGLIYHLSDKYTVDKPTVSGQTSEYEGKSGFGIQYYRQIKKKVGIVLDYSMGEMKSTAEIPNTNDIKWDRMSIGLVFTNFLATR
jgi:hypothetical protein